MRVTKYKYFTAWDFDKEEKWLNEMAAMGYALCETGYFRYVFEDCTPGEYNIRLELLNNMPSELTSMNYIKFIEDTGAEYLGACLRWAYFRKKTTEGEFDLYSDNQSRINHLKRILTFVFFLAFVSVFLCVTYGVLFYLNPWQYENISFYIAIPVVFFITSLFFIYGALKIFSKFKTLKKQKELFE